MASASKEPGYVDDWQAGKTVTECNLHMLTTEDCSDVIFRVGSEKHVVRAHRYVLVSRSCVFHAMFSGPLAEKGEVTIPDIEPQVFKDFLRYLYTDTVNITDDNVTGLLYTSRKYAVDGLLNKCSSYLDDFLSDENVCQILEESHVYGELDLEERALKILTEAGAKIVKSPGFLDLCETCLQRFLESEQLKLEEEEIFEASLSWTKEKCKRDNVSPSPENLRRYLGDMRYEIRFASMSQEYLVKVVRPSGVLTNEERVQIMDRNMDPSIDITPFKTNKRNTIKERTQHMESLPVRRVQRFTTVHRDWFCDGKPNAVSISVNKNIQLMGCELYGPSLSVWTYNSESIYSLNILLYDDQDQVIAEPVRTQTTLKEQMELNDVMFPEPVPLQAGRTYTIWMTISGEKSNYGGGGRTYVEEDGVQFTFKNSPKSTDGYTTAHKGLIPGLIWTKSH